MLASDDGTQFTNKIGDRRVKIMCALLDSNEGGGGDGGRGLAGAAVGVVYLFLAVKLNTPDLTSLANLGRKFMVHERWSATKVDDSSPTSSDDLRMTVSARHSSLDCSGTVDGREKLDELLVAYRRASRVVGNTGR